MNILWVGNVAGAIEYLTELPSDYVKSEENRRKLIRYLQNKESVIACCAVRRRLGLRISSNAVEKANDLTSGHELVLSWKLAFRRFNSVVLES